MEQLNRLNPAEEWMMESAQGRVDRLKNLQSEAYVQLRETALKSFMDILLGSTENAISSIRDQVGNREEARTVAEFWLQFIRDLWIMKINTGALIHGDSRSHYEVLPQMSQEFLAVCSLEITKLNKVLNQNADIQLAFENLIRQLSVRTSQTRAVEGIHP